MDCPTGLLVNLDNNEEKKEDVLQENTFPYPVLDTKLKPEDPKLTNPPSKLCGFLTKVSTSGIIKISKPRWFSFNNDTCELLYYRSKSEVINNPPLGKISLHRASFNFSATDLKEKTFTILADSETHILQAYDKQTLMWWLQELQSRRRHFNTKHHSDDLIKEDEWHGSLHGQSLFWIPNASSNLGLLGKASSDEQKDLRSDSESELNSSHFHYIEEVPDSMELKPGSKSRSLSVLSSSSLPAISKRGINAALTNAGEVLKHRTNKFRFGGKLSEMDQISESAASAASDEINYPMLVCSLKQSVLQSNEEMELMKTKLQSKEEVIELLKLELKDYDKIKGLHLNRETFSKEDYKLRSELITSQLERDRLEQEKKDAVAKEQDAREKISMLEEMLIVKDQVVVQLSNQIYELESSLDSIESDHKKLKAEKGEEFVILTPSDASESFSDLKDRAEGYMFQNKFLNNEILELARLRQMDAQNIQTLQDKLQQHEAEYCQLRSKYLVLLSEMNKPRSDSVGLAVAGTKINNSDDDRKAMMKILIQEAIQDTESKSFSSTLIEGRYDRYGFETLPNDDTETTLLVEASHLQKRSSDILQSNNNHKMSVIAKWENYLEVNKELQCNVEIKNLIRLGIPHKRRPQVWSWIVNFHTASLRENKDSSYYFKLLERREVELASKQIELDLLRTLPNNKHYSSMSSPGIKQLRRVLRAYSVHNPHTGYCQGLNRIAAVALLYLSEEDAFWCLVAIVECILPSDYYGNTLTASQADQRVLRDLMAEKLPRLHKHFEMAGVDTSLITFNWLLCIYCDNVPPETMLHIWDCFLYEGSKVLFRFGLAFFKFVEEELLQLTDYMAIFTFLRVMSHRMNDVRTLHRLAFDVMNPFPMRRINRLRQIHMEKVSAELAELDALRRASSSTTAVTHRQLDSDDD